MDFEKMLNSETYKKAPISELLNPVQDDETPAALIPFDTALTAVNRRLERCGIKDTRQKKPCQRGRVFTQRQRWGYPTPPPSVSPRSRHAYLPRETSRRGCTPSGPHSNKPYTMEQVDFIRYHHIDLGMKWNLCRILYAEVFPGEELRNSCQCMNSRFYRDNVYPLFYDDGEPLLDEHDNQKMTKVNLRDPRRTSGLHPERYPLSLIEKSPERAENLAYTWIRAEDRERLQMVLQRIRNDPVELKKFNYRKKMIARTQKQIESIVIKRRN